jgi:hypothetical protein
MHRPETLKSGIRQGLDRRLVTDVGMYGQRFDAQRRPDSVCGARQRRLLHICKNDVHAVASEPLCERQPNAARSSRNNGDLPGFKLHCHPLPSTRKERYRRSPGRRPLI